MFHAPSPPRETRILVISSEVVVGRVGISVIAPAYSKVGVEGFFLPTLLLSSRPGLGRVTGQVLPAERLDAILSALDADGRLDQLDGLLTGYFANGDQIRTVARHVRNIRKRRPDMPILVDPVIGDSDRGLFVDESVAAAIRDNLLPLASITTPNQFELSWLSNIHDIAEESVDRAARTLVPDCVVVTSASVKNDHIESRCIFGDEVFSHRGRRFDAVPNGTGDLLAGLYLAQICAGQGPAQALTRACVAVERVADASSGAEWLDLASLAPSPAMCDEPVWVAGVDGCRTGWAVVFWDLTGVATPRFRTIPTFAGILDAPESPRIVAVDMPIGLPERTGAGGRGPESAVRPLLGKRRSSVFSIPSRLAVYAKDYRTACAMALSTSSPPRKVSKQGFMLFEKIKEVDGVMTPDLSQRVFEVHPELAFWRLNGGQALATPKKIKGRVNPAGIAERRALLEGHGFDVGFFDQILPKGVASDDFADACACALIAVRLAGGLATPFPENPEIDAKGLTVAIWA